MERVLVHKLELQTLVRDVPGVVPGHRLVGEEEEVDGAAVREEALGAPVVGDAGEGAGWGGLGDGGVGRRWD